MGTREVSPAMTLRMMRVTMVLCSIRNISEAMLKGWCLRELRENLVRMRLVEIMGWKLLLYRNRVSPTWIEPYLKFE
jgi:hypothetical protein